MTEMEKILQKSEGYWYGRIEEYSGNAVAKEKLGSEIAKIITALGKERDEARDQVLKDVDELVDSIRYQDPAVQAYYDELKTKLKILSMDITLS